jgi:tetratricopeptide (TPR) repeat protein
MLSANTLSETFMKARNPVGQSFPQNFGNLGHKKRLGRSSFFRADAVPGVHGMRSILGLFLVVGLLLIPLCQAQAQVKAYRGTRDIPTYPWWPPVRHPYFRATDERNIYPYPMLDNLQRVKENRTWRTVVLENEFLRVTFIPELGGRVYEVIDKTTSQPMFYVNHVVKPGLIGQCGAWISGGIEFNTGPAGHTVSAVQPVDVEILPATADGSRSVAVGEVEKIYRTHWTVLITLHPGTSLLDERIRIYNPTETVRPYYFWNCTAVPNTHGFRFIYPMTLGTDHSGHTFYKWPVSDGKDLSLGRSYQDASSIFAYKCDQDFFGSYDEEADRGVVSYANHYVLPGKKAWTWGNGSYGTMHQMDLTDNDGPYNEVQTGPLPTQADVGRLDPGEAVSWQEWWYPIHGLGSFIFANRDLAVNAATNANGLGLRILGTKTWRQATVKVLSGTNCLASLNCDISPRTAAKLELRYPDPGLPVEVEIGAGQQTLGRFRVPLDLPVRTPPAKKSEPRAAAELTQDGWQEYLFARFPKAIERFRAALEKDPKAIDAQAGLAILNLDRDPAASSVAARAALSVDPDLGLPRFALAVAEYRAGEWKAALDDAWLAALDPTTATPARALVAKILIRRGDWPGAANALQETGPWQADPLARNRLAFARLKMGEPKAAAQLARQNLQEDALDAFARSILWLAGAEVPTLELGRLIGGKAQSVVDLAAEYAELGQPQTAFRMLDEFYLRQVAEKSREPLPCYWAAYLASQSGQAEMSESLLRAARTLSTDGVFPHRVETIPVLEWALKVQPGDGHAALYLGHLLFSLGRHEAGRTCWKKAVEAGVGVPVACRALGMACRKLDGDAKGADLWLERGNQADPSDPIVAMDLAQVFVSQADKAASKEQERELMTKSRAILSAAFETGKGRSDFVALLARAHNRLGEYAETARLLDSVRIIIWEGAREAHDLFEEAHLALGNAHLKEGHADQALAEFNRALDYPENLATGRLQDTREAHIYYLRGNALAALGQKAEALASWKKAADEPATNDSRREEARKSARAAIEKEQGK